MRVIFMGTPDFAVPSLKALMESGHEIVLTVTQPDRPKGRGGKVSMSAVKEAALLNGLTVFQPEKIRRPENIEVLRQYDADVIVVVAFGQILPKEVLELPRCCCINVHGSLLPKYRGASPVQWTVLQGDTVGGVTTMRMDEGLDTGDIILQREIPLDAQETAGSYFDKVSSAGADLLIETLQKVEDGTAVYRKQDEALATRTGMITKAMGRIDFSRPAGEICCQIRGMDPWPSAYTFCRGKMLKIWRADAIPARETEEASAADPSGAEPGTIARVTKNELLIRAGDSTLLSVRELQAEGKKRMETAAFLRGFSLREGEKLG